EERQAGHEEEFARHPLHQANRGAEVRLGLAAESRKRPFGSLACLGEDGTVRDLAWYSIVLEEWPAVKERLEARLRCGD
ncbi:MAG: hypothetical protein QOI92_648, partial [Chloroflexota bacterium]|nr:hypothetical protein [Chloroflexota bacterium]